MAFSSWRGIVGMINPTMRPGATEEVIRLLPLGIGLIPLFLDFRRGTTDEFKAAMPAYERNVALLAEQGCDLAMMGAAPGSASQRNAERHGFRIAYTRIKWRLAREHSGIPGA